MSHFITPPYADTTELTVEGARLAMAYSFFHWGVSQWSVFTIVGLIIAYFQFRRNADGLISTSLSPLSELLTTCLLRNLKWELLGKTVR